MEDRKMVNTSAAAVLAGKSLRTIYNYLDAGIIESAGYKRGSRMVYLDTVPLTKDALRERKLVAQAAKAKP